MKQVFKRETDILGRYGGEEFIVVLSDIQKEQVEKHCDALLNKWTEAALEHAQDAKHPLMSCSIGVVFAKSAENMYIRSLTSSIPYYTRRCCTLLLAQVHSASSLHFRRVTYCAFLQQLLVNMGLLGRAQLHFPLRGHHFICFLLCVCAGHCL